MKTSVRFIGAALLLLVTSAVSAADSPDIPTDFLPALTNGQHWQLTWHDEFNGAQIDTNKWEIMGDSRRRDDWWASSWELTGGGWFRSAVMWSARQFRRRERSS